MLLNSKYDFVAVVFGILVTTINRSYNKHPEVFCKKVFLTISQNSQENTCAEVTLNKVAGQACKFIKK